MAMNVFGNPITISTLQGMAEYHKKEKITRLDMARVAFNMKNARGNDFSVCKFVETIGQAELQGKNENDDKSVTLCVMYNATGGTMTFVTCYDWEGHLASTPFPATIANGQWAGFVHTNDGHRSGGTVVYRGKNERERNGEDYDFIFTWSNSSFTDHSDSRTTSHSHGYSQVLADVSEKDDERQHVNVRSYMELTRILGGRWLVQTEQYAGCICSVSAGCARNSGAFVEAIFTLNKADIDV